RHRRLWRRASASSSRRSAGWGCPSPGGRGVLTALRNQTSHPACEAAKAGLVVSQRPDRVAAGGHSGLYTFDERFVFRVDLPVDSAVQVAGGAHFWPVTLRRHVGNIADERRIE